MNQVLVEAVGQGRPLPAAVVVTSTVFFARYRKRAAFHPAQADYYEDVIYINPESYWFRSRHALRKYARRAYRGGQIATDDPAHLLRHEYGHLLHKSAAGSAGLPAEAVSAPDRIEQAGRAFLDGLHRWPEADRRFKEAAARVSVRAADSPVEFVAEVFAGAWGGRRFHEDVAVMEGYRHYRGPVLLPRG
jgi:hypothetical protein